MHTVVMRPGRAWELGRGRDGAEQRMRARKRSSDGVQRGRWKIREKTGGREVEEDSREDWPQRGRWKIREKTGGRGLCKWL